jgi:SAM-dependent methyltransferase
VTTRAPSPGSGRRGTLGVGARPNRRRDRPGRDLPGHRLRKRAPARTLVGWTPHGIEPYGLDFAPALAELARRRLPQWADRIFVGADALTWEPPTRFDFVRTELVYVPAERRPRLVERLLADVVAPGGRLILSGYGQPA